jgi:hypothetical protein
MKNCNLLNRIAPQVFHDLRSFTNGSARNLGTKLLHGHISTIAAPVIARRKPDGAMLKDVGCQRKFLPWNSPPKAGAGSYGALLQ